jgi:hypothetical protein
MDVQRAHATRIDEAESLTYDALAESLRIDYAEIAAATEPDQPGGRIVYNSADYETEEKADEALEDFFDDIMDRAFAKLLRVAAQEKP